MDAIQSVDPEIAALIEAEDQRQRDTLRLIPSENYASAAVMAACGTSLTNKYSEGYAGRRYYQGQGHIDGIERLAVSRAKALFGAEHANVQPYSGSPANLAIYFGLLQPGDTILSMSLPHGGHLTHGWKVTISGKFYNAVQYGVAKDTGRIDFDQVAALAAEHKPKMIICGASAYPRIIDFARFAEIAEAHGALLLADIAHISGLVAGGAHPNPFPHADVVSTTTHKTLRGPRGGMILCKKVHKKAIDRAVFPGLQGGPHNHATAGMAIAFKEAATPEFQAYARQVVTNAQTLAEGLKGHGFDMVSGGTDNHLILIDLTNKSISGKIAASALEAAGIVCNANSVPFDPRKPFDPSGIRIGTPAITSRGMGATEMQQLADWMAQVVAAPEDAALHAGIAGEVKAMCAHFPAPGL
jgi:glycine hydroxymethyltransferase